MKSTAKKLAFCAVFLCLLACGTAVPAFAAGPLTGTALSLPWNTDVPAESIEAGSYSSNMLLGATQQLSPVVRPRNTTDSVIYITDDSSVLTVSNTGLVQAVGVGTATITAAAGNQICAYTIVVSMDSSMIVTEMDLSLSSNTFYVGNSVSASLQVRPSSASNYATVTLTSSKEKVATVNNFGRVTGVSPGTATITATCGSVTATTTVTVLALPASETGSSTSTTSSSNSGQVITTNSSYVVLKPGSTFTLTAKATPSSASQSFTYKSGNSGVATVSPTGVITAVGTGATAITVSNGKASTLVTVIVNRSASSSTDENGGDNANNGSDNTITLDPVVQAIQDSTDDEIVFAQSEVPVVNGDILNALRTTGKTLYVVGDGYTMQISGKSIKNTTGELNTALVLENTDDGIEFVLDEGLTLPCTVQIDLDVSTYSRLYLYNTTTNKWQYLNSYKDGSITADTAGRYLLTNQNLRFSNINWTFFIAGGVVVVIIAIAYIVIKKRYWFW